MQDNALVTDEGYGQAPRYWCPRAGNLSLDDDGYLLDPETFLGQHVNGDLVTSEEVVRNGHCVVLLGEPGMGKSTVTKGLLSTGTDLVGGAVFRYDLGAYASEERLVAEVFRNEDLERWRNDPQPLLLILDSYDECRISTLPRIVEAEIARLASAQLRVVLACRTAGWPVGLEKRLGQVFDPQEVAVYELAPLRRTDVATMVRSKGFDPEQVLVSLSASGTVPLAIKPVTLQLLLADMSRGSNGGLTPGRGQLELYERGLTALCDEWDELRRDADQTKVTPEVLMKAAGRLAIVMTLSAAEAVWTGPAVQRPSQDIDLSMAGLAGQEGTGREVWSMLGNTGLFSSRGPYRFGFAHQTYMEFLAARYLADLPHDRVRRLIADGDGNPVEALRSTISWLIALKPQLYGDYARRDPVGFTMTAVEIPDDRVRREIVAGLFANARDYDVPPNLRQDCHHLMHPGLAQQIGPVLRDKGDSVAARYVALWLARTADDPTLAQDLAQIGGDSAEPLDLRIAAISTLGATSDPVARAALKPLIQTDSPGTDEIKGSVLSALYPRDLSMSDVLPALTPPQRPETLGAYQYFLSVILPRSLTEEQLPEALNWVAQQLDQEWPGDWLDDLWDAVVRLAWHNASRPAVCQALAALISHGLPEHRLLRQGHNGQPPLPVLAAEVRQALASEVIASLQSRVDSIGLVALPTPVLVADDFAWLTQRCSELDESLERDSLLTLARYLYDPSRADHREIIFDIPASSRLYGELARQWIEPMRLDQEDVQELRKHWRKPDRVKRLSVEELRNRLSPLVAAASAGDHDAWWQLNLWLSVTPDTSYFGDERHDDLTTLPGWTLLDPAQRQSLLIAAQRYLREAPIDVEQSLSTNTVQRPVWAGYRALALLSRLDPAAIDDLPADVWRRWAGITLDYPLLSGNDDSAAVREALVKRAYALAPDEVIKATDILIDQAAQHDHSLFAARLLAPIIDTRLSEFLASTLASRTLPESTAASVLEILLESRTPQAISVAVAALEPEPRRTQPARALTAARQALHHAATEVWPVIWNILNEDPSWGAQLFLSLPQAGTTLFPRLSEEDLANLYTWSVQQFPPDDDPPEDAEPRITPRRELANARNRIPSLLTERGTPAAVAALERIIEARPDAPWLRSHVHQATRLLRLNNTRRLEPAQIIALLDDEQRRVVHDERDLASVVTESLGRLQHLLQGHPTPQAFALWDEEMRQPKNEDRLSDYAADFLRRDLSQRGVIVNREVEIQRKTGSRMGERTDLYVQAISTSNARDIITLIIETKGCWHSEVTTAMQTQLVERYLKPADLRQGIYLVFWFSHENWNNKDSRYTRGKRYAYDKLVTELSQQAIKLRDSNDICVTPIVVDGTLAMLPAREDSQ